MSWVKIDDGMFEHPKIIQVGPLAVCVHMWALGYCARHLTDGKVTRKSLRTSPWLSHKSAVYRTTQSLIKAGLWEPIEGGFQIHDYLDYNPDKASVQEERARAAERVRRWRAKRYGVTNDVMNGVRNAAPSRPLSSSKEEGVTSRHECGYCGYVKRTRRQLLEHEANVHNDDQALAELNQLDTDMLPAVDEPA